MKLRLLAVLAILALVAAACGSSGSSVADDNAALLDANGEVIDSVIADDRVELAAAFAADPFGPQAPRDIESAAGVNPVSFPVAPAYTEMNLCNIHFHEAAEHKGGEFTTYNGNGDRYGYNAGYKYNGTLSEAELAPFDTVVGETIHGDLQPGDTIEIHYVHSTDDIQPGPTLGSCLDDDGVNPLLRVEGQVYVLVNDPNAADLVQLTTIEEVNGLHQAVNLPGGLGNPVQYAGSTTGPSYNLQGSPFQVSWSVHPNVLKVDIASVQAWFENNPFDEGNAHAVRNLVTNPDLLSPIG